MDGYDYSIALFLHFVSLLAAGAGATLAGYAALQLRGATSAAEVARWGMMIGKVVRVFPAATLGLVGTGAYMTQKAWSWSTPWVVAGLVGLTMIVLLGAGVEASRGRALEDEVRARGLSERARRLLRDPLAWTSKAVTWTLMLAVMFVMSTKPPAWGCAVALLVAVLAGAIAAVPIWTGSERDLAAGDPVPTSQAQDMLSTASSRPRPAGRAPDDGDMGAVSRRHASR